MSESLFNKEYELSDLVSFVGDKIEAEEVTLETYISTDNMLVDRGGVKPATKLPSAARFNYFKEGDTLFSNIRTYFRKVWLADFEGGASPDVLIFRSDDPEILDPIYLYFLLSNEDFVNYTVLTAKGAKMPRGDKAAIMQYKFFLPEIDKQQKIGFDLLAINKKIVLNRQTNKTLEQIAQAIFKSWFVDFEPVKEKIQASENGENQEHAAMCAISGKSLEELEQLSPETQQQLKTTAALFPDALVESKLGGIPKGWKVKKLKDICRVLNGRAYKNTEFKEKGTPIVRIQNLSKGGKTVYSDLDLPIDKLIHKEDFIYAWSATFGPHIWRGSKSIYHYHIWKMDVNEKIISRYFLYLSMFRKTEQMKSGATGSIFTHLTKSTIESQEILVATPELNLFFKNMMEKYFKKITAMDAEIESLENLKNSLLPKLLSGELENDNAC